MARKQIAKIALYGNTVSWMDPYNCIYLTTHKDGKLEAIVYDDMNLDTIREGIRKCLIKVIEGKIPEPLKNDSVDLSNYATISELSDAITNLIGGADENSDTLKELADLLDGKVDVGAIEEATVEETVKLYK